MADTSTRSLLPRDDYPKSHSTRPVRHDPYKLPFLIIFFFLSLVGCIITSTVILLTSHGDSLDTWWIMPSVLLSILTSVYTALLGGLFAIGVVVVWWRNFGHGTTLKRLHFIIAGASPKDIYPAIIAGGHARRVALAALVVYAVKLAIGPIVQRSTTIVLKDVTNDFNMTFNLARNIPDGWFGVGGINYRGSNVAIATLFEDNITLAYANGTLSGADGDGCRSEGICKAKVAGAGLNFGCKNHTETIPLLDQKSVNRTLFAINLDLDNNTDGLRTLYLETKFLLDISDDCIGTVTTTECQIIPAIMWYDVFITNSSTIQPDIEAAYFNPQIAANATSKSDQLSNFTATTAFGTLQGLYKTLQVYYQSEAVLADVQNGVSTWDNKPGTPASYWADIFKVPSPRQYPDSSPQAQNCSMFFASPTNYVMQKFIEYMFRAAVQVAQDESGHEQTFLTQYLGSELKFSTEWGWFAVSMVLQILGVLTALSLLWGFWHLHHYPTLSPLETGRAFGAPVFAAAGPEREAKSILTEVGHERVAYDGDELVWSGNVYATGAASSQRTKSSHGLRDAGMSEMDAAGGGSSGHSSMRGRGHRRGMSSVSDASPVQTRRPSFEHSLGYTTRRPYDEEEMDLGQYGRARSSSGGSDRSPLIPPPLNVSHSGSPKLPPIQRSEAIRMEELSPPCGRMRRGSRCAADAAGMGRRPLSKIEERATPEPDDEVRWR